MRDTEPPRVVVADIGTDAALYSEPGNRVLVLRPGQTFSNAVAAAQRCLPNAHPDVIRTVVRTYLPDAPDFDLPSVPPVLRSEPVPVRTPVQPRWFMSRTVMVGILCVATALSLGGWGLVGIGTDEPPVAAVDQGDPNTANVRQAGMEPYKNEAFRDFAKRGELTCDPLANAMRAACTDWEGSAMVSEATIGADRIIFTFQYGKERVSLGIFTTELDAATWAKMNQDREGVRVEGRFVLWGTDKDKLDAYKKLLVNARKPPKSAGAIVPSADHPEHAASATSAGLQDAAVKLAQLLPKQLGAIVMGTLGVTSDAVDRAGRLGIDRALSPAVAVAVRLALGVPPPREDKETGGASNEDVLTIANEPLPVPSDPNPAPPTPDPAPPSDPEPDPAPPPADPAPDPEPAPPPSDPAPPPSDPAPPPSDPPPADPEPSPSPTPPSDPDPSPTPGPGTEDDGGGDPAPAPNDDGSEKGPTTDEGVPTETGDPTTPPPSDNGGDNNGNNGDNGNDNKDNKTESESDQTSPAPEQPAPGPEEHAEDDGSGHGPGDESTVPTDEEQSPGDQSDDDCTKHEEQDEHGEQAPADAA